MCRLVVSDLRLVPKNVRFESGDYFCCPANTLSVRVTGGSSREEFEFPFICCLMIRKPQVKEHPGKKKKTKTLELYNRWINLL